MGLSDTTAQWVEVRRCNWVHEAHVFASVLASEGIDSTIPDEFVLGIQPFYTYLLGGVRLMVRPEDLERARELLDSTTPERAEGDPQP